MEVFALGNEELIFTGSSDLYMFYIFPVTEMIKNIVINVNFTGQAITWKQIQTLV